MGLIDLKITEITRRKHEQKALNDWQYYCHLARLVGLHWARLETLAIIDACKALRKTE